MRDRKTLGRGQDAPEQLGVRVLGQHAEEGLLALHLEQTLDHLLDLRPVGVVELGSALET